MSPMPMLQTLKKYFGYNNFRPLQKEVIDSVMAKKDTFVLMPTGGGKSLCYQLPALLLDGVTLVISPLIALMKDQVDSLETNGISAAFINSSLSADEKRTVHQKLKNKEIKLLYVAPERLALEGFQEFLKTLEISLIAIDEAHCISEWGHDFRPDYHKLSLLKTLFPEVPTIALTATATHRVQKDIISKLKLHTPAVFIGSFNRPNLSLHIKRKRQTFEKICDLLDQHPQQSAIIYCFSRNDTEKITEKLQQHRYNAAAYHAGLSSKQRKEVQELFITDEITIIVATVAFGMGIDKPDVRLVVHYTFPKTLEGYYQEIGRAGRDGLPSECVLFYSYGDKRKHDFFIDQLEDETEQLKARAKLQEMIDYCESPVCRRQQILAYFGEEKSSCGNCDVCLGADDTFDATELSQKILSAVIRTGESFGMTYIIDTLKGSRRKEILENFHDTLSVHGIVKDYDKDQLIHTIKALIHEGYLIKEAGQYPTLSVSQKGKDRLISRSSLTLPKRAEEEVSPRSSSSLVYNEQLFAELRSLRKELADERHIPPFMVFSDLALQEMSHDFPLDEAAFLQITGVGEQKLASFGEAFLAAINGFVREHDITPPSARVVRRPQRSRSTKVANHLKTQELLGQGKNLEEIARELGFTVGTIINHISKLISTGETCAIDHIRPSQTMFTDIQAAIQKVNNPLALKPVFTELKGKYGYDDIKLVKCLMEVGG